jgi:hypothetical protein
MNSLEYGYFPLRYQKRGEKGGGGGEEGKIEEANFHMAK